METIEAKEPTEATQKSTLFINRNFTLLWMGRTISITGDLFFSTTMILWFTTSIARGQSWAPLALLGLANAGSNVIVGPLKWRATPREFIGRVEAAFTPMIIALQMVSVSLAGYLTATVLSGLHATFLGMVFTPVDTIFTGAGLLIVCAGVYALVAMRGVILDS